jgi:RNA polymerase sigma factor for flagellar operon FliA
MTTNALWTRYAAGDEAARSALLEEHLTLVHHVARQMRRKLNGDLEHDELVSAGTLGLLSALSAFEPARGLAFSTFAVPRIRGAMLDELRRLDHVPRSVRRKTRDLASARNQLAGELGRKPSDGEVAKALGVDLSTLWKWEADVDGALHVPLNRPDNDRNEGSRSPADVLADSGPSIDELIGKEEDVQLLRDALMELKPQERTVLALYYLESLKLHEIADVLEVTESRVSQIRSKALGKLRERLKAKVEVG